MSGPLLTIEGLRVHLSLGDTWIAPVDGVTLSVERGEFLGIAGESGSGKSLTLRSIVGLLPAGSRVEGRLLFSLDGETERTGRRRGDPRTRRGDDLPGAHDRAQSDDACR